MLTKVKSPKEIQAMRESGRMLAEVLKELARVVAVGQTTKELAAVAAQELKSLGGKPAFLGYQSFPSVLCTSVNDEVVHGIPSDRELQNGDIVTFDFGVTYQGMITDAAESHVVGTAIKDKQRLLDGTKEALMAGIKTIKGPTHVGDISAAVQAVMEKYDFGIVRDLVGHGVGHSVHEEPNIPNYGKAGEGMLLEPGMTIAIEPMSTLGSWQVVVDPDGWTVRTQDRSLSAHYEHTVLITEDSYEILTQA